MTTCTRTKMPQTPDQARRPNVAVTLPARLTWKDQRGTTRFASVVTRNVSEFGVYVECQSAVVDSRCTASCSFSSSATRARPTRCRPSLRHGRVLSAVYRVTPRDRARRPPGPGAAPDGRSEAAAAE